MEIGVDANQLSPMKATTVPNKMQTVAWISTREIIWFPRIYLKNVRVWDSNKHLCKICCPDFKSMLLGWQLEFILKRYALSTIINNLWSMNWNWFVFSSISVAGEDGKKLNHTLVNQLVCGPVNQLFVVRFFFLRPV